MVAQKQEINVLIVDDHQVVRQGLRTFLELHDDIAVVGEASNGQAALEMARRYSPDVILMDLVMPGIDGIEVTRQVKAQNENMKVIALTSFTEDDKVFPAIQAGASSYLLKDVSPDDLVEAIRTVHRGQSQLHPDVARKLMDAVRFTSQNETKPKTTTPALGLTERERDVVRLIAQGLSNQQIAQALIISEKTAKTHVSNILSKLNLEDRTQLAIYALKNGLAESD